MPDPRIIVCTALLVCAVAPATDPAERATACGDHYLAGFRASRLLENYPGEIFPPAEYWVSAGQQMAASLGDACPGAVWIVGLYQEHGDTRLEFPSPGGRYKHVSFSRVDYHESYLDSLDSAGFKVWLQVEPGAARVEKLIDLVLQRYGHHPCVAGVGIDVEWFDPIKHPNGRRVSDKLARRWESRVTSYDPRYTIFLKHWDPQWMPPTYRGNIFFIDDSLGHDSLDSMAAEFAEWGRTFAPNPVGFQIGYPQDRSWWSRLADPPQAIGHQLVDSIPNLLGVYWVDFTIVDVIPLTTPAVHE